TVLAMVVLPQPDSPARPTISLAPIRRSTPSTARARPYSTVRPRSSSSASRSGGTSGTTASSARAVTGPPSIPACRPVDSDGRAGTPARPEVDDASDVSRRLLSDVGRLVAAPVHGEAPPLLHALGPQARVAHLVDAGQDQREAEDGERERRAGEEERPP